MKRALKEISEMATSLEATGVDRQQAGATLEAIANSIEKFAVTPEQLRETLEASLQAQYERIKAEMDQRFNDVNRRIDDMRAEQRADSSRLFNLMLAMALGMAGVAGSLLFGPLF